MGATTGILLQPCCPPRDDPEVRQLLELVTSVTGAPWARLELEPEGGAPESYEVGAARDQGGAAVDLDIEGFSARLRVGSAGAPGPELLRLVSFALERALHCRRYNEQVALLRGALDTTSSAALLFDAEGGISYANPPADRLLSRQTEHSLTVEGLGGAHQPVITFLCSLVERVAASPHPSPPWTETLSLSDGTVLACEILQVDTGGAAPRSGVLAFLQPVSPLSKLCLESFCARHGLSPREEDVVRLVLEGVTTLDMAERLSISLHTVRDHLKRLYRKTGAKSRSELLSLVSTAGAGGLTSGDGSAL